jgi:DNA-binding CsgD family transcriptional regulator
LDIYRRIFARAGLKNVSALSARRTIAERLVDRGCDVNQVGAVLGLKERTSVRNLIQNEQHESLNIREREILTLAAAGQTSKEIAGVLGIAKVTVDIHVGTILTKMGALNRNQAIAKAIVHNLIQLPDDVNAEHKSAKLQATRRAHQTRGAGPGSSAH